ncbi:hypothetical protein [Vibrio aestuarianus]|uniref:Uncharacterized protein n=1 Tax=Vibrio aestuarianus TaxID=28171 RepID=A0ABN8TPA3_9VIBR|nr:hypothetical protein [Vibrio aestuarianus]CAH8184163.1 hypothetical protein VAE308_1010284 [Vibrio aestuarianus]CAH8186619.1 hypothetical protein VAE032_240283 [Vibrio aestuarianus]CAH8186718.1 hypothetical protein VAE055_340284 [Vibrio aestuarianus]CAH8186803.1 hypothetical protein VAE128_440285 [Vibrio aestuarianus]CAH8186884.1 hypothetical protein VAE130_550286 [Vibrio aestuarianus]
MFILQSKILTLLSSILTSEDEQLLTTIGIISVVGDEQLTLYL